MVGERAKLRRLLVRFIHQKAVPITGGLVVITPHCDECLSIRRLRVSLTGYPPQHPVFTTMRFRKFVEASGN